MAKPGAFKVQKRARLRLSYSDALEVHKTLGYANAYFEGAKLAACTRLQKRVKGGALILTMTRLESETLAELLDRSLSCPTILGKLAVAMAHAFPDVKIGGRR